MSHLLDFMLKPEADMDVSAMLTEDDIQGMDIPMSFDNNELMSSDFFDSVLSMEKQNLNLASDGFLCDLNYEGNLSDNMLDSSPSHTLTSENCSLDGDNYQEAVMDNSVVSILGRTGNDTLNSDEFLSLLEEHNIQTNINDILGVTSIPKVVRPPQPQTKKIIITKPATHTKKGLQPMKKQQVIRVQSISGNGRSLLLPVNVKNVKKFKIISASDLKMDNLKVLPAPCQVVKKVVPYAASSSSESVDDIDVDLEHYGPERSFPALQLTPEEKRLLVKEGIKLPTHYPLTKNEEKELKRIRRKIRNKISAQDSRKRKKEYVDQLEEKARRTDEENEQLKKRVKLLNRENTRLFEQLKKLQELLFNPTGKATPTTCLMIVLFSTLLVCLPNLRTTSKDLEVNDQQLATSARRALLFNKEGKDDEEPMSLEEFLIFNKEEGEIRMDDDVTDNRSDAFVKYLGVLSKKYETIIKSNCSEILQGATLQEFCKKHEEEFKLALQNIRSIIDQGGAEEKKFIEPDISDDEGVVFGHRNAYLLDDDDPPTKKVRISSDGMEYDKSPPLIQPVLEVEMAATTVEPKLFRLKTE